MHSDHKSQHRLKCLCIYTYIYMKHNNPHIICHSDFILMWLQDVAVRDNRNSLLWDNDKVMHKTVSSLNIATKEHLAVCRQFNCKSMKNVTGNSVTRLSWCNKTSSVQSITISGVREMILLWRTTRLMPFRITNIEWFVYKFPQPCWYLPVFAGHEKYELFMVTKIPKSWVLGDNFYI